MSNKFAFFDFDGTLTTKDTMFDFLAFSFGKAKLYQGLLASLPVLALFKCKLYDRQKAKQHFLHYFFRDITAIQLNKYCEAYAAEIDKILRPEAMERLRWHQQNGHTVFIVSASVENWILPWAKKNNIDQLLATGLDISPNGSINETFRLNNCYGPEKVNRILHELPNVRQAETFGYGDSNGDKEMLALVQHKYYRKFI